MDFNKGENWVKRYYDRKSETKPKKPLTSTQKDKLMRSCWNNCFRAYTRRMTLSQLVSPIEEKADLVGECWIAMKTQLERFDLSKCGLIGDKDIEGEDNPKTLEWYFTSWFSVVINGMATDSRSYRQSRVFFDYENSEIEIDNDNLSDPQSKIQLDFGSVNVNAEYILNFISSLPVEIQECINLIFYQGYTGKELRELKGEEYYQSVVLPTYRIVRGIRENFNSPFVSMSSFKKRRTKEDKKRTD